MNLDSSCSLINSTAAPRGILMKLYRVIHKTLTYHMNWISQSENKSIYFVVAPEIDHCKQGPLIFFKSLV